MNGFTTGLFWQLWAAGLLGVVLKMLLSWADKTDTRTQSFRDWLDPARIALAIVAHTILCTILWESKDMVSAIPGVELAEHGESGYLSVVTSIMSGYAGKSVVVNILGVISSRVGGGKE